MSPSLLVERPPGSVVNLEQLRRDGDEFMGEVSRGWYDAFSGRAASVDFQGIYARFAHLVGRDAFDFARELHRNAVPGSPEARTARLLLEWQVESSVGRALATLDEREIAWEQSASLVMPWGETIPWSRALVDIANTTDRTQRQAIDDARAARSLAELAPIRKEKLARERDLVVEMGIAPDYIATFEAISGVNVHAVAESCRALLRDTQAMWDTVAREVVRSAIDVPFAEVTRADMLHLLRGTTFDGAFPASRMQDVILGNVREMGLDPTAAGRIILDTTDRPGKRSRAFCAPVRVPDEVYLVTKPQGGVSDYRAFLHELGHALHFAHMRSDLPFEERWVGDAGVTEAFAMLFDHRLQDRGWLARSTALGTQDIPAFRRAAAFEELQLLRRYAAKLLYEIEVYGGEVSWDELPDRFVETLGAATSSRYQRGDAFTDLDPRFYSTRYLRAWQLQAVVNGVLVERFNEDWWRNPAAGPWIAGELFGPGQRETAEEMAERVAGTGLSFAPLIRAVEAGFG